METSQKKRVKNRKNHTEEQRLSLPSASARSAFTHVGIAGFCARMIAAKVETEKILFLLALGVPKVRGFCQWVLTRSCPAHLQEKDK